MHHPHKTKVLGIQYLIKWKGYPNSENSWLPATGMKHALDLVRQFHDRNPRSPKPPTIHALQAQPDHKEGMLLRTDLRNKNLSQHVTVGISPNQSHDPGSLPGLRKQSPDRSHVRSHAQSRVKSLAPLSVSGPSTSAQDGPRPETSPLSIVNGIRGTPLARPPRIIPTHRPINSHDREKASHG